MAQAQPDTSTLIADINKAKESKNVNEFAIAGFRRRAAALRNVELSDSFVIEGILDSLEKKLEDAQNSFRKALDANPTSWFAHVNYSITLRGWGEFRLAYDHAIKATTSAAREDELVEAWDEVRQVAHLGLKIKCLAEAAEPEDAAEYKEILSFMERNGISDDDLDSFAKVLHSTLNESSSTLPTFTLLHGEAENLYIQTEVEVSPEEAAELSFILADNLAEHEIPAYVNRAVTIGVTTCQ